MDVSGINKNMVNNTLNSTKNNIADDSFEKVLKKAYEEKDEKKLKEVCNDFESIILNMLYKQMKLTVSKSNLIPNESGREIFQSMLDEELVDEACKEKGIGIGKVLYEHILKTMNKQYKIEK